MDKNIFNSLLNNVDTLQTRLRSYNSFSSFVRDNEYRRKSNGETHSKIEFNDKDGDLLASFTLDSKTSRDVLSFLIERTKTDLKATAETIKSMIIEEE